MTAVERIDTLVQRLRSLGSPSPSQMSPMSVLMPLHETLALISGELTKCRITLAYEHSDVLPAIMGDHDQVKLPMAQQEALSTGTAPHHRDVQATYAAV